MSHVSDESPHAARVLDEALLQAIGRRAAGYDAANAAPADDIAELAEAGYLRALVPASFGGGGLSLAQLAREQSRLAGAAPASALAVNMHHVWVAVAAGLHRRGDRSLDFLLAEAAAGEIFAFGVSERGNDLVLFDSLTEARPLPEGGYAFTGTKIFTSLSGSWTRLGTFGADRTDPGDPRLVWAFVDRDAEGIKVKDDWDALGMRASQSRSTVLTGVVAPADRIVRTLPPGPTLDPFVAGIFASFEILLSAVYTGLARRALDLAAQTVARRHSVKNDAPYAHDPDIRWRIAQAAIDLDGAELGVRALAAQAEDEAAIASHGGLWLPRLSALKHRSVETALRVVEQAVRASGGAAYGSGSELSRLYRDVLAGIFHPSDAESVHGAWANALLGPVP